jgi:acetyl-CoA acetyltransferase
VDCALALGFEQMRPGALGGGSDDRPPTLGKARKIADQLAGDVPVAGPALQQFGGAGREHMARYGTKLATFAKVRAKASRHANNNPLALFRKVVTEEEVLADQVIWPGVMTRLMPCPPTRPAACSPRATLSAPPASPSATS